MIARRLEKKHLRAEIQKVLAMVEEKRLMAWQAQNNYKIPPQKQLQAFYVRQALEAVIDALKEILGEESASEENK